MKIIPFVLTSLTSAWSKARSGRVACTLCLAAGVLILFNPCAARGQSGTWINKTTSGNWGDSANWVGGIIADGAGNMADTPQLSGGTYHIDLDTDRTIGFVNLRPNEAGISNRVWVLNGPGTLTLSDPGNPPAYGSGPRINVRDGISVCNAVIAGNEGMAMSQLGILFVTAANTYTGDTVIFRGRLQLGNVDAIPHGSRLGNVVIGVGGNPGDVTALDLQELDITINGLNSATNNVTTFNSQVSTWSATAGTSTLTIGDNDANGSCDADIVDGINFRAMAITKIGAGTQALNGSGIYSGTTTVEAGKLLINGQNQASPFVVNGGVLGGIGTIYMPVTVNAGGAVSAGASPGTMTLYGGLDLSAGGTNIWDLAANSESNPGTDYDQIVMYGGTLDLSDSTLIVNLGGSVNTADPFWNSSHTWTIISAPGLAGASTNKYIQVVGGTPPGYFSTANDGNNVTLTFNYTGVVPQTPKPVKITSIVGAGTGSVTVNYTNTIVGTNYTLQYRTNLSTSPWLTAGSKTAAGTTDSQTDGSAGTSERYYRVGYFFAP